MIEDTAELQLQIANLVRFEARRAQAGLPAVTIRDLLRATLRHRPDRLGNFDLDFFFIEYFQHFLFCHFIH